MVVGKSLKPEKGLKLPVQFPSCIGSLVKGQVDQQRHWGHLPVAGARESGRFLDPVVKGKGQEGSAGGREVLETESE